MTDLVLGLDIGTSSSKACLADADGRIVHLAERPHVTGLPQELRTYTVGASYGDAWLAATGCGLAGPRADWNPVAARVSPDPDAAERYAELYDVYRELYPATSGLAHGLAAIQES